MCVYTFIRCERKDGYKHALVFAHMSGQETTLNNELFDGTRGKKIEENTHFVFGDKHEIIPITEEEIPAEIEKINQRLEAQRQEALRIRAANIATGRFIYEDHPDKYTGQIWQICRETISDNHTEFKQAALDRLNKGRSGSPVVTSVSFGANRLDEFLTEAKEGDRLEWYDAYRDPMAASSGLQLVRDGVPFKSYTISVS